MRLKDLRLKNNMTQEQVAKMINKSSVGYGYYETGRNEPDLATLIKLADIFHTTVDVLLDHQVPYLLDKSLLSNKQNELLNTLVGLTDRECERVQDFIQGMNSENKK